MVAILIENKVDLSQQSPLHALTHPSSKKNYNICLEIKGESEVDGEKSETGFILATKEKIYSPSTHI